MARHRAFPPSKYRANRQEGFFASSNAISLASRPDSCQQLDEWWRFLGDEQSTPVTDCYHTPLETEAERSSQALMSEAGVWPDLPRAW